MDKVMMLVLVIFCASIILAQRTNKFVIELPYPLKWRAQVLLFGPMAEGKNQTLSLFHLEANKHEIFKIPQTAPMLKYSSLPCQSGS